MRFHYGHRGGAAIYSATELQEWPANRAWRRRVEVFAYFNNDWNAFAVRNALALKEALVSA